METINNKNAVDTSTTATVTETVTNDDEKVITMNRYIFLAFAEYLGYISPFIDWVMDICKGKDIPTYQKDILKVDALTIYHRMVKECDAKEIKSLYDKLYELILSSYESKIVAILSNENDLPF